MTIADLWLDRRSRRPGPASGRRRSSARASGGVSHGDDSGSAPTAHGSLTAVVAEHPPAAEVARRTTSASPHDCLRRRGLHRRRGRRPAAVLHQPRRAGVRPGQPARGGEGRPVRPVQPLAQEPAPAVPRRVRRRPRHHRRPQHRRHRRAAPGRGALRPGVPRVRRRLGRPARRRAPRLRAGVEPADQGARVGPADVVPRAVHPLHRLRRPPRRPLPLLPRPRGARVSHLGTALRGRPRPPLRHLRRAGARRCSDFFRERYPKDPARLRLRLPADASRPRRSTPCAGSCRRPRCRTSASTAPARPTRRCCCACGPTRCPRPAATPT